VKDEDLEKVFGLPTKTMSLESWLSMQEDGALLQIKQLANEDIRLTGLLNIKTKELYITKEQVKLTATKQ
jgi:hypothetical protein